MREKEQQTHDTGERLSLSGRFTQLQTTHLALVGETLVRAVQQPTLE